MRTRERSLSERVPSVCVCVCGGGGGGGGADRKRQTERRREHTDLKVEVHDLHEVSALRETLKA